MEDAQATLLSYSGIAALVVILVGGTKKLFASWIEGKEPVVALAVTMGLGILSKATIPGAFAGIHWVAHVVSLVITAFGAKIGHDYLVNQVMTNKGTAAKLLIVSALCLSLVACSCTVEKHAVSRLSDQQEKVFTKYLGYVDKDPALDRKAKDDERLHIQSVRDLTKALKESLED